MTGYELMTPEQRQEWDDLEERRSHSNTMRFTALDEIHRRQFHALAARLEREHHCEADTGLERFA